MKNYPVACAWCKKMIREGDPDIGISHGICEECSRKMFEDDEECEEYLMEKKEKNPKLKRPVLIYHIKEGSMIEFSIAIENHIYIYSAQDNLKFKKLFSRGFVTYRDIPFIKKFATLQEKKTIPLE